MAGIVRARCDARRLSDANTLACGNARAGHVIPAAQIVERNAEAVCDLDQRVAFARAVAFSAHNGCRRWSNWNDESFNVPERIARLQLIDSRELFD